MVINEGKLNSQAHWLAQGYLQGQRDFLVKLIEKKFDSEVPDGVRMAIDQLPDALLDSIGPKVLLAPDAPSAIDAVVKHVP